MVFECYWDSIVDDYEDGGFDLIIKNVGDYFDDGGGDNSTLQKENWRLLINRIRDWESDNPKNRKTRPSDD